MHIPAVLTLEQATQARQKLDQASWVDGRVTAGYQSSRVKDNLQLPEQHPVAIELGGLILGGARIQSALHVGGAAAASVSAALQPLPGRPYVR